MLTPFRTRIYRAMWSASLVASTGALIQAVGAAWLMTSISSSESMVALVQAAAVLPTTLLSALCGAIADNFDRRRIMLSAQFAMLLASVALLGLTYAGLITPWLVLGLTFLIGCGTALYAPAWHASIGDMVPREDLPAAVALNATGNNLARSVGPALGGVIVAGVGTTAAFALNAISYLAMIAALWRWKPAIMPRSLPPEPLWSAVIAGVRYVAMSPNIGRIILRSTMFGFAAVPALALLPLIARDILGGGAALYGVLFGSFGIGAVLGGLSSATIRRKLPPEAIVRIAFAAFALALAVMGTSPWPWLTVLALILGGACQLVTLSLFNISVQFATPRWIVGRTLALFHAGAFGGMAFGSWIWGIVAEHWGPALALQLAGVTALLGAAAGIGWLRLPPRPALHLDPAGVEQSPPGPADATGPVSISIEYTIAVDDVAAFLRAMQERRGHRLRAGARRWRLARDVERPDQWIESYELPSWTEYERLTQRSSIADALLGEQLGKLHRGDGPPALRHFIGAGSKRL